MHNLTLASPELNRFDESGKDAAEWQPPQNECWFAQRVIDVRLAYDLTIDRAEADALDRMLVHPHCPDRPQEMDVSVLDW